MIRHKMINLGQVCDPDRRGTLKFHGIGHEDRLASVLDNGFRDFDLAIIIVKQRAVAVDARCANDCKINFELADKRQQWDAGKILAQLASCKDALV